MYQVDASAPGGFRVEEELVTLDGWRPVATIRPDSATGMNNPRIFPILTDHLGTPRKVLDGNTGQVRWSWDAKQPFGHELPNEAPTAGLPAFTLELRFPGQRFDEETGLFHNGFRDYHSGLGRYVQSDPLGLEAGWNTYSYVENQLLFKIDPYGLSGLSVRDAADAVWAVNSALLPGIGDYARPSTVCVEGDVYQNVYATADVVSSLNPYKLFGKAGARMAARNLPKVFVRKAEHPESAGHIADAIKSGYPSTLTIQRAGAKPNRSASLRGIKTQPGKDRDEYPPAMFKEGGAGSSVRHIGSSDNRGAGACIGRQCSKFPDGTKVKIIVE